MPILPIFLINEVTDLYDFRTPDGSFTRNIHITADENVIPKIKDIVWLSSLMSESASFIHSFIDRYKDKTDLNRGAENHFTATNYPRMTALQNTIAHNPSHIHDSENLSDCTTDPSFTHPDATNLGTTE